MKIINIIIFSIIILTGTSYSQEGSEKYKGKTFIFNFIEEITPSDALGKTVINAEKITTLKGSTFTVEHITQSGDLVIQFNEFKIIGSSGTSTYDVSIANRTMYNYLSEVKLGIRSISKPNDNIKYFLLEKKVFETSCTDYEEDKKWDINFGTMTTPFKFRRKPSFFTTSINLGTCAMFQYKFKKNWNYGFIGGLSLTSVSLDSFSTEGVVKTNTERPAFTPSIHFIVGYKNINLTIGIGADYINRLTPIEQSWAYHGKSWIGLGLGVSLFSTDTKNVEKLKSIQDGSNNKK